MNGRTEPHAAEDPRRRTPRVDVLLSDERMRAAVTRLGTLRVRAALDDVLAQCRAGIVDPDDVVAATVSSLPTSTTDLQSVVNATGVLVHTNLGRAPLSPAAQEAMLLASGTTDVELDLTTGRRGRRGRSTLAALLRSVPAAEDAHVVNNGAAALSLVAVALKHLGPVVVARGELIEIGDGFRLPELIESVGAELREVGTTNRVKVADYAAACEGAAFILKVHPSNFVVSGFTASVSVRELAALGPRVVVDIGSGLLRPHPRLPNEPDAASALSAGAALVTASGDKLLGGPQCGLLLGEASLIQQLRQHPLARAFRVDKTTLAALEATVAGPPTPVAIALDRPVSELIARASQIVAALPADLDASVVASDGVVGGGGAPDVRLESAAVSLPAAFALPLRSAPSPIMGRLKHGRLLLDLLAVDPAYDATIVSTIRAFAGPDRSDDSPTGPAAHR